MTAAIAKADTQKIRKEVLELSKWLIETKELADRKIVRLTNLVYRVQHGQIFRDWINPKTKKPFKAFQEWIEAEVGVSRAQVYRLIDVKEHLKNISDKDAEEIGSSRLFEIVKVAKTQPKLLSKVVAAAKKSSLYDVKQMVTNVVAAGHFDSGNYIRFEYAVKDEDADTIFKAFTVMQALGPVKNPENPAGRGLHLLAMCHDYLLGEKEQETLGKLEKAGAFKNGNTDFKIEE
jgi:hypothetical protein